MNKPILKTASTPPILLLGEEYKVYLTDKDWKEEETEEGHNTDVGKNCQKAPLNGKGVLPSISDYRVGRTKLLVVGK